MGKSKVWSWLLSLLVVLIVVIFPQVVLAQTGGDTPTRVTTTCSWSIWSPDCWVPLALSWVLAAFIGMVGSLIALLTGIIIWVSSYNGFISATAVVQGWGVVRDIANMFFVLVLLIISFGTILHVQQYQMKTLLPKVILMAILVNFSKAIAGLFIDFAQVIMLTFVAAYSTAGAGNILDALGMRDITSIGVSKSDSLPGVISNTSSINNFQIVVAYLLGALFALVALVVVIAITLILFVRIVMLWLLIVFSPLAYVLSVVPAGQKYAQQWWDTFSKYVIIGPVLAFFLWLSLATFPTIKSPDSNLNPLNSSNKLDSNAAAQLPPASISALGAPDAMVGFIVSISMLIMSLIFAQQVGGAVGKIAGNAYGKIVSGGVGMAEAMGSTVKRGEQHFFNATGVGLDPRRYTQALKYNWERRGKELEAGGVGKGAARARAQLEKGRGFAAAVSLGVSSPVDAAYRYFSLRGIGRLAKAATGGPKEMARLQAMAEVQQNKARKTQQDIKDIEGQSTVEDKQRDIEKGGELAKQSNALVNLLQTAQLGGIANIDIVHMPNGEAVLEQIIGANRKALEKLQKEANAAQVKAQNAQARGRPAGEVAELSSAAQVADDKAVALEGHISTLMRERDAKIASRDQQRGRVNYLNSQADEQERQAAAAKKHAELSHRAGLREEGEREEAQSVSYITEATRLRQLAMDEEQNLPAISVAVIPELKQNEWVQAVAKEREQIDDQWTDLNIKLNDRSEYKITNADKQRQIAELKEQVVKQQAEARAFQKQAAGYAPAEMSYADAVIRKHKSEELKDLPEVLEATEIGEQAKLALAEKNVPRFEALFQKATTQGDYNEFLKAFDFGSTSEDVRRFFEEFIPKELGIGAQNARRMLTDLGYIAEKVGHTAMSRWTRMENGVYQINTAEQQADFVTRENEKKPVQAFFRNSNRLSFGGEDVAGNYELDLRGKMTLARLQNSFVEKLSKGDFNPSLVNKLATRLDQLVDLQKKGLLTATRDGKTAARLISELASTGIGSARKPIPSYDRLKNVLGKGTENI